jgi:hypothetical protein
MPQLLDMPMHKCAMRQGAYIRGDLKIIPTLFGEVTFVSLHKSTIADFRVKEGWEKFAKVGGWTA